MKLCFIFLIASTIAIVQSNAASTGVDIEPIDTKSESDDLFSKWPEFVEGPILSDKSSADELIIEQLNNPPNAQKVSEIFVATKNSEETYSKMPITPLQRASKPVKKTKKRYHIVPLLKANWVVANMYCKSYGMRALTILSMEEQGEIVKMIKNAGLQDHNFWTTGRKTPKGFDTEGDMWYWFENGQRLNFTNWGEGEPNNKYGNEECIGIYEYVNLQWNDFPCDYNLNIICEEEEEVYSPPAVFVGA